MLEKDDKKRKRKRVKKGGRLQDGGDERGWKRL